VGIELSLFDFQLLISLFNFTLFKHSNTLIIYIYIYIYIYITTNKNNYIIKYKRIHFQNEIITYKYIKF